MLVMENKQRIILVIQIMTNNLVTLIQVNLRQKKLVMMTLTIPMRGDMSNESGNSKEMIMEKVILKNKQAPNDFLMTI